MVLEIGRKLEETNKLLDDAIAHILRNAGKAKEVCNTEKMNLFHSLQTFNALHLTLSKQYNSMAQAVLIDDRQNYLVDHADRVTLLIDRFYNAIVRFEDIANNVKNRFQAKQINQVSALHKDINTLLEILNTQFNELTKFINNYRHDAVSQTLENSVENLRILGRSLNQDTNTFLNIVRVAIRI